MTTVAFVLRDAPAELPSHAGRYEYRTWPLRLSSAIPRLQRDWALDGAERRSDIYLLGANSARMLVKLRDGLRLEIKRRGPNQADLQYWSVDLSRNFPLSPAALDQLAVLLLLPNGLPLDSGRSPGHLLARLCEHCTKITPQIIRKARLRFRRGTSQAEVTHVGWQNQSWITVALEDPDQTSAARVVGELGLAHLQNRSYGEFLQARLLQAPEQRPPNQG